jgi:hypothetical protein
MSNHVISKLRKLRKIMCDLEPGLAGVTGKRRALARALGHVVHDLKVCVSLIQTESI